MPSRSRLSSQCAGVDVTLSLAYRRSLFVITLTSPSPPLATFEGTSSRNTLLARLPTIKHEIQPASRAFAFQRNVYSKKDYTESRFKPFFQLLLPRSFQPGQRRAHCCCFASSYGSFLGDGPYFLHISFHCARHFETKMIVHYHKIALNNANLLYLSFCCFWISCLVILNLLCRLSFLRPYNFYLCEFIMGPMRCMLQE